MIWGNVAQPRTLLPKLLSGELRVPEAEALVQDLPAPMPTLAAEGP